MRPLSTFYKVSKPSRRLNAAWGKVLSAMDLHKALLLLKRGCIQEWNHRRSIGEEIPSLLKVDLESADLGAAKRATPAPIAGTTTSATTRFNTGHAAPRAAYRINKLRGRCRRMSRAAEHSLPELSVEVEMPLGQRRGAKRVMEDRWCKRRSGTTPSWSESFLSRAQRPLGSRLAGLDAHGPSHLQSVA